MPKPLAENRPPQYGGYIALTLILWLIGSVIVTAWAVITGHIYVLTAACLSLTAVLVWLGRIQAPMWDTIKNWAQLLSFSGIILTAYGVYKTYLTPFSPEVASGTIQFRLGPNTYFPGSEMVIPLSFSNSGAETGRLDDLEVMVSFSKGDCLFDPYFFVAPDQYTRLLTTVLAHQGTSISSIVKETPFDAPFGPILLTGKSQVSKAVIFGQSPHDCKTEYIEAGRFPLTVYGQYNHGKQQELRKLWFDLPQDKVDQWKAGTTVAVQMMQRDPSWLDIPFRR